MGLRLHASLPGWFDFGKHLAQLLGIKSVGLHHLVDELFPSRGEEDGLQAAVSAPMPAPMQSQSVAASKAALSVTDFIARPVAWLTAPPGRSL